MNREKLVLAPILYRSWLLTINSAKINCFICKSKKYIGRFADAHLRNFTVLMKDKKINFS
jgi:hypothetical protein